MKSLSQMRCYSMQHTPLLVPRRSGAGWRGAGGAPHIRPRPGSALTECAGRGMPPPLAEPARGGGMHGDGLAPDGNLAIAERGEDAARRPSARLARLRRHRTRTDWHRPHAAPDTSFDKTNARRKIRDKGARVCTLSLISRNRRPHLHSHAKRGRRANHQPPQPACPAHLRTHPCS